MKWKKMLSLKQWSLIFRNTGRFIVSKQVHFVDKLLFLIPVILYWILPDLLPFMPIDDIGVTMIMMNWFVSRMERKYPFLKVKK